jgi:hypothetical protein
VITIKSVSQSENGRRQQKFNEKGRQLEEGYRKNNILFFWTERQERQELLRIMIKFLRDNGKFTFS